MPADWQHILVNLGQLTLAFVLALPIAVNREQRTRIMGLRTFPLVAMGACAYVLVALDFLGPEASQGRARVLQGLISGIGFVGGGAILKDGDAVRGTASAASIWITGAIGAAVAFRVYELAVVLSLSNFLTLRYMQGPKQELQPDSTEDHNGLRDDET